MKLDPKEWAESQKNLSASEYIKAHFEASLFIVGVAELKASGETLLGWSDIARALRDPDTEPYLDCTAEQIRAYMRRFHPKLYRDCREQAKA